jgi:hypothetical protein
MWVSAMRFWSWGNCTFFCSFFLSPYLKQLPANLRYRLLFLQICVQSCLWQRQGDLNVLWIPHSGQLNFVYRTYRMLRALSATSMQHLLDPAYLNRYSWYLREVP